MAKSRKNMKKCPKCGLSVAIALKSCNEKCGYSFSTVKQTPLRIGQSTAEKKLIQRKTKRVRQENPKFSGSVEVKINEMIKQETRQKPTKALQHEVPQRRTSARTKESRAASAENRIQRQQELRNRGEDKCGQLSIEKQKLAALFLSEINRKLSSAVWRL